MKSETNMSSNDSLNDFEKALENKIYEFERNLILNGAIIAETFFSLDELEEYAELQRVNRQAERE